MSHNTAPIRTAAKMAQMTDDTMGTSFGRDPGGAGSLGHDAPRGLHCWTWPLLSASAARCNVVACARVSENRSASWLMDRGFPAATVARMLASAAATLRSEERRVGKECR